MDVPAHPFRAQGHGGGNQLVLRLPQQLEVLRQCRVSAVLFHELAQQTDEILEQSPLAHGHLSSQQIHGLDAGGAFIDGADLGVAQEHRDPVFLAVPVSTVNLHGLDDGLVRHLRGIPLADRCEQFDEIAVALPLLIIGGTIGPVEPIRHRIDQAARGLHDRLLGQQHTANVRMFHNGDTRRGRISRVLDASPLNSFMRIIKGQVIGGGGLRYALGADPEACMVHQFEHHLNALVLFTDNPGTAGTVVSVRDGAGSGSVNAHLFFDARSPQMVEGPDTPVVVDQVLRRHEQAQALDARRGPFHAGQENVDHVLVHVVIPTGDEGLVACKQVGVPVPFGRTPDLPHRAPRLGLREDHGPGPDTCEHFFTIGLSQEIRAFFRDQIGRSTGKPLITAKARIGGNKDIHCADKHGHRKPLPPQIRRSTDGPPTALVELLHGVSHLIRNHHLAVYELCPVLVRRCERRSDNVYGKLFRLVQNHLVVVGSKILVGLEVSKVFNPELFKKIEMNVPHVNPVRHHGPP